MDSEEVIIDEETEQDKYWNKRKKKVCAVGTTSMRAIETSVTTQA